ncbi:acyl transferase 9-like [Triticum dicoccoides]|uniref:acyl transferase 9-like n=1 Tax=Triticum dicoccoides TaxID=85692 RepID=UPI00188EA7FD|nr:acyl transferase 9-like [Triticum dicoccoides]
MRLASWLNKGLDWASSDEACQEPMWKFNPVGPRTLQRFFGTKHEDMWKLLFKTKKSCPEATEDLGYNSIHDATPITKFTCGGFVMGLRFNHASADGMGAAQFIKAVGDMARGLPEPAVKPVWDREKFPNPSIKPGPLPELPVLALDYIVLDFPTGYIDGLKTQCKAHSGKFCSGFDVLTAKLWQCRTRALNLEPEATVKLCFFASVRHLLKLDAGYYGNSIFPVKMSGSSKKVLESSVMEVIDMIREAKQRMAVEFFQFAKEETRQDPFQMSFDYESIYVSDWSKLGFSDVDYGFGPPMFAGPLVNNDFIASVVILKAPLPLDGTRMLASCVTKEHSEEFARGMKEDLP